MNLNNIYKKQDFINSLLINFNFNKVIANKIYDEWYEKELELLKLTESFN